MIPKMLSRNSSKNQPKNARVVLKPKTRLTKLKVANPVQQQVKVVAYSPKSFFKDSITNVFKEMTSTYGNIPLWVDYSMHPESVSWNLGSIQATHNVNVRGEEQFVKELLSRFNDAIGDSLKSPGNGISILSQSPSESSQNLVKNVTNIKTLSTALQKTDKKTTFSSELLSASGLIAGLAGVVLALSFFSGRRSSGRSAQRVSRQGALRAALNSVSDLTSNPVLESEEFTADSWHFSISDYIVTVNSKGTVTEVRRRTKND